MYTNADSLTNKYPEFELLVKEHNYDIIAITEVLPKNTDYEIDNFILNGYKVLTDNTGRGVSLFIRDNIEVFQLTELESIFNPCVLCRLVLPSKESFVVGVIYRSPNSTPDLNNKVNSLIDVLSTTYENSNILLMGDFNHPGIDWSKEICNNHNTHPDNMFLETIQQNYLFQMCDKPTHHRALQHPNILDLILTNNEHFISPIKYLPPLGKSHHSVLNFCINAKHKQSINIVSKYQFNKGNYNKMREYVGAVPWNSVLNDGASIDDMWNLINDVIQDACKKFVPKIIINNNHNSISKQNRSTKTVPRTMLEKIHFKRRAHKMYKKFPTITNYNCYAKARNQVKWESRKLVKANEASLALEAKNNPKRFFKYVASKTKTRECISHLKKRDNSLTSSDKEKAEVLNEYFCSVFTREPTENIPDFNCGCNKSNIDYVTITKDQMLKALQKLNINKSPGPDEVNPRILKELANELAHPLSVLFNKSMSMGKLPSQWKVAIVKPIFKKGNKAEAGNYRPVSLTSVICKMFEGFVRDVIYANI